MAIDETQLSTNIQAEIVAILGAADDSSQLKKFSDAIAKAIVDHLKAQGTVLPGTFQADGKSVTGLGQIE